MNRTIDWRAPGPNAWQFYQSKKFVQGILGPIGSGKTTTCILKLMTLAASQPMHDGKRRSRFAVIRNTYPELRTTTMKSWFEWVPQDMGRWQPEGPPTHFITGPDGLDCEVMFVALDRPDDVRKLLSLELTAAWINEAREIPKAILDGLTGRVGRFPPVRHGGCVTPMVIMDTNAPDSDHWWYTLAEEGTPPDFAFFRQPGGRDPAAENIANLPSGYYERAVQGKDADWIKVYVDAQYGYVRDGKPVWPDFVDSLHCQPFELLPNFPLYIGMDFGLTPAATIGQRDAFGAWNIRHELVTEDMGVERFGSMLAKMLREKFSSFTFAAITGDPAGNARDGREETVFDILRGAGVSAQPAPTNDFTMRVDAVAVALRRIAGGKPGIRIHPDCRQLRKGMAGAYCLRRLQVVGQERYKDAPDKNMYSHVCESLQYLMLGAGEGSKLVQSTPNVYLPRVAESNYDYFASGDN